ncbi:hypothetical protein CALVIDRAFT_565532 [Calocera viscosa TUFC12733]|uniref:F-box domain-containing protein n=1 Tax=Calocera viscosa (strain TUFC12733) TaxID=1330018 RepID=A0A167KB63_CALVF|nr:hypothetical protein CALVIDRAFT_565532 [Calocera viscosa TUFC12733]
MRTSPDLADVLHRISALKRRRLTRSAESELIALQAQADALSAPVYALPVELVSSIFLLAASSDPHFPLTASHVSRSWRAVAQAYAPLWSNIRIALPPPSARRAPSMLSIGYPASPADTLMSLTPEELYENSNSNSDDDDDESDDDSERQLAELAYFLARAGDTALSISLDWAEQSASSSSVTSAVRPHLARCASLRLSNRGPALPHITSITPCPGPPAARLRALDLGGFCLQGVEDLLHLLSHTPALRSLALRDVHFSPSPPLPSALRSSIATPEAPLLLPHLADLLIDEWAPYLCAHLLPCLSTPRLQALTLSAHTCDPKHLSHLSLSPPEGAWSRVRFVRARGCAFTDAAVLELLERAPAAESVLVHGGLLSDTLLQLLSRPTNGRWLAPRLRSAYLHTRLRFTQEAVMRFIDARLPPPPQRQRQRQRQKCMPLSPPLTPASPASPSFGERASGSSNAQPVRQEPPTPVMPPTPTSPSMAGHTAPTPLRLLGLFGIPHSPEPSPLAAAAVGAAQPTGIDIPFRLWLSQRVGPESLRVPNWTEFRRRILERVASGAGSVSGGSVSNNMSGGSSGSGLGGLRDGMDGNGEGVEDGYGEGEGVWEGGGAAALGEEDGGVRFFGEGVGA